MIVGSYASGKTELAKRLSRKSGTPHIELDAIYWRPGWRGEDVTIFREKVKALAGQEAWIIEGHFTKVSDLLLSRADKIIWLDVSFPTAFARHMMRSFERNLKKEILWNGNRETWGRSLVSLGRLCRDFQSRRKLFRLLSKNVRVPIVRMRSVRQEVAR